MKIVPFTRSTLGSIGIELEYQIVDTKSYKLVSRAKDLIRNLQGRDFQQRITPEITQSMIEINTSIHQHPQTMLDELGRLKVYLLQQTKNTGISFCGGGTHPFQKWHHQKIFPTNRYKALAHKFGFLTKQATIFGQHIHVGCVTGANAVYLTHALARYVPQLIAICASSPFHQRTDTGFYSARSTLFNSFPLSGVMPYLTTWQAFSSYFNKMRACGVLESMKDVYWDIRPKPEFGTVEIRVCDTPLTIRKAVLITAFIQALVLYLIKEKPIQPSYDLYYFYHYNRFLASRYGLDGIFINPYTEEQIIIRDDILNTINLIEKYSQELETQDFLNELKASVIKGDSDSNFLRQTLKYTRSYSKLVAEQCRVWSESSED